MEQELLYNTARHQSNEEAYQALTNAISDISENLNQEYFVAWVSEGHDHRTTSYTIVDTGTVVGEDTLFIEGGRGGSYEIIPKPANPPYIRYWLPAGEIGWEEELKLLMIAPTAIEYEKPDDEAWFLDRVKDVKDRLGL